MPMPKLDEAIIRAYYSMNNSQRRSYAFIERAILEIIGKSASTGLQALSSGLGPLGMALSPWINARIVYKSAKTTMDLHSLVPTGRRSRKSDYACVCKQCDKIIHFVIDKRESSASKKAISSTVVLAPLVGLYMVGRNSYKYARGTKGLIREGYAKKLTESARPIGRTKTVRISRATTGIRYDVMKGGCRKAQAAIAILLKELSYQNPATNPLNYAKTMAAITSADGWVGVKKAMN